MFVVVENDLVADLFSHTMMDDYLKTIALVPPNDLEMKYHYLKCCDDDTKKMRYLRHLVNDDDIDRFVVDDAVAVIVVVGGGSLNFDNSFF